MATAPDPNLTGHGSQCLDDCASHVDIIAETGSAPAASGNSWGGI